MLKMPTGDILPITDVIIIADLKKVPYGYDPLDRSSDAADDCDLWKDGIFSKNPRYLCISRKTQQGSQDNALVDILILEERSVPPVEYRVIEKTYDSGEKATKKKNIAVKFIPRTATTSAICDLTLLSMKSRKASVGYTSVGQINGLTLCYKMAAISPPPVPSIASSPLQSVGSVPTMQNLPAAYPPALSTAGSAPALPPPKLPPKPTNVHAVTQRLSSLTATGPHSSALDNVPFKINAHYNVQIKDMRGLHLTDFSSRSLVDIENEYAYSFADEYSVAQR